MLKRDKWRKEFIYCQQCRITTAPGNTCLPNDPERERDRNPVRWKDKETQHLSLGPWEKGRHTDLRDWDSKTETKLQR